MKIGVDVGYNLTKVIGANLELKFKSTVSDEVQEVSSSLVIEYKGTMYTIGENDGIYATEIDKINDKSFKLCLYTAIARAMKNSRQENVQLVTGLPAQYFKEQKDKLIDSLKNKEISIKIGSSPDNLELKQFRITDVIVFPQSAGVLVTDPNSLLGDTCVIDIGGFTVDISYFSNRKFKKPYTLELGMNILSASIVGMIKSKYKVSYDVLAVDDILNTNTIIKNGTAINIKEDLDKELKKHANKILNRLTGIPEYNISQHIFIGGGSVRLQRFLNTTVTKDSIYTNARAFYKIGVNKFED